MDSAKVERAVAAVTATAVDLDLPVNDVAIIQNSTRLSLRLLPCDVFARVAPIGHDVAAAFEVDLAQQLCAVDAPVAALDARFDPSVHQCNGFPVTFWTFYDATSAGQLSPADHAHALEQLHAGMRTVGVASPHVTDRIDEALGMVAHPHRSPALDSAGRELLLDTLTSVRRKIVDAAAAEQLLHGEPHPGNVLNTSDGPRFIDLETCCRGPVEFDAAHVPGDVGGHYPELDHDLLDDCRRLALAMVAAWRWDADDQFPDRLRHGRTIMAILREGPPWPTLGELAGT